MSLITPLAANKDHQKFLNRLERYYHKRGASSYIPREKIQSISFTTKIPSEAIEKVKGLIHNFMLKIHEIIKEFTTMDHYAVLDILRKNSFFSDVAVEVEKSLYQKIEVLEKELNVRNEKIERLKEQLKINDKQAQQKIQKLSNIQIKPEIKYNPSKNVALNIYYHARALDEEDFVDFYHKISLSSTITLKKIESGQNEDKTKDTENIILSKVNQLVKYSKSRNNQQSIKQLITLLKQYVSTKKCKNPCCQQKQQATDNRLNKAKTLMTTTFKKSTKDVYKDQQTQQYFEKYYRKSSFNVNDITSIAKTRWQELEKMEIQYNKSLREKRKLESQNYRYL